jgi:AbrB family looped-hinge helix DNA binding protein
MIDFMKTMTTLVTERGQVSIPAEIRRRMKIEAGMRLVWKVGESGDCTVSAAKPLTPRGARAMLGYAATFRTPRPTREWMKELREGESK